MGNDCRYNEDLYTNGEDSFISNLLKSKGLNIYYDPEAIVFHLRKDNFKSVVKTVWNYAFYAPKSLFYDTSWRNCIVFLYYRLKEDGLRPFKDLFTGHWNMLTIDIAVISYIIFRLLKVKLTGK